MPSFRAWLSRIAGLFGRRRADDRLRAELDSHLAMLAEENQRRGLSPEEARRQARITLGGVEQTKQLYRKQRGIPWLDSLFQDVRFGLRILRQSPGFAAVAILTLALGIGANTAIFSMVDSALLKPLPVSHPQTLVVFEWTALRRPSLKGSQWNAVCPGDQWGGQCSFSYPMFQQFRGLANVFAGVAGIGGQVRLTLTGNGPARNTQGELVSGNFFQMLGVPAALGRTLEPSDDVPGAAPVADLSYGYWQRDFGGNRSIVGKTVQFNGVPVTVVGVIPKTFPALEPGQTRNVWLSLSDQPEVVGAAAWHGNTSRGREPSLNGSSDVWWIYVLARLRPGVRLARAQAAADLAFRDNLFHGSALVFKPADAPRLVLMPAAQGVVGDRASLYRPLMILMLAVGIVLLIACANVAGLLIARSAARQKEMAVRLALGAGRSRIVRQLLTESVLLSAAGGAAGILFAYWTSRALSSYMSAVHLDMRVLAFTAAVSLAAGILFGLAPASRGTRVDLTPALKEGAGGAAALGGRNPRLNLGNGLVVAQVALSVLALVGAGLLVRTLANLEGIQPGFDAENLLIFGIDPALAGYSEAQSQAFYRNLQDRLAKLPGVISASYSFDPLLFGDLWRTSFQVVGPARRERGLTDALAVGPKFAETMGIPLLAGRTLSAADFAPALSPRPVIVNESFVREYFAGASPLGRLLEGFDTCDPHCEIVGVVGDAKYQTLRQAIHPTVYVPQQNGQAYFEVRTAGDPRALVPTVRAAVGDLNGNLPVYGIHTQRQLVDNAFFQQRYIARLAGFFALLALLLGALGLYGLMAYSVARRRHELGIRMALGAQRGDIARLVLGQGIKLTLIGLAIGAAAALALTHYLSSMLYGVTATDPLTFLAASALLAAVALFACALPARRAARVDPAATLRQE